MTATARAWRLRGAVALAVALLVAAAALTLASASQLNVNTRFESRATALSKCASQVLTATPSGNATSGNYTAVQVSGIAAACQGLSTRVELRNTAGTLIASGTTTPSGATAVFTTASYAGASVTAAVVKVRGWLFTATWQPASNDPAVGACAGYLMSNGSPVTGTTCTLTAIEVGQRTFLDQYNGGPGYFRSVQMSTDFNPTGYQTGSGWANYQDITLWRYTLNLTASPYGTGLNLAGGYYLYNNNNNAGLAPGEDCSNPASVTFQEATAGGNPSSTFVVSERPITWMSASALLCHWP